MINKKEFEEIILKDNLVEYFSSKSAEEVQEMLGSNVARMIGYDQNNAWHCYDLWEHTLRVASGISKEGLTDDQYRLLRIAVFFHDIGKPEVKTVNAKTGEYSFKGHPQKSAEIAIPILQELGYDGTELEMIDFFVRHHDDFMKYRARLEPYMNPQFIRITTAHSVAKKLQENRREGCHESLQNYKLLLKICRADANAQSEVVVRNSKIVGSRSETLETIDAIENVLEKAYDIAEKSRDDDREL